MKLPSGDRSPCGGWTSGPRMPGVPGNGPIPSREGACPPPSCCRNDSGWRGNADGSPWRPGNPSGALPGNSPRPGNSSGLPGNPWGGLAGNSPGLPGKSEGEPGNSRGGCGGNSSGSWRNSDGRSGAKILGSRPGSWGSWAGNSPAPVCSSVRPWGAPNRSRNNRSRSWGASSSKFSGSSPAVTS